MFYNMKKNYKQNYFEDVISMPKAIKYALIIISSIITVGYIVYICLTYNDMLTAVPLRIFIEIAVFAWTIFNSAVLLISKLIKECSKVKKSNSQLKRDTKEEKSYEQIKNQKLYFINGLLFIINTPKNHIGIVHTKSIG